MNDQVVEPRLLEQCLAFLDGIEQLQLVVLGVQDCPGGAEVKSTDSPFNSAARVFNKSSTARCPTWTPSKVPMVNTADLVVKSRALKWTFTFAKIGW